MKEKIFILILASISAIAPLATDMYLPALSLVQKTFSTNEFYTQLSIASFFVAFALGQLIYGPLSDVFGRKIPLLIGLFIFMVSSFLCFVVDNIYAFIILRFLQAFGGCAGAVITRAIVIDSFDEKKAVTVFSMLIISTSLAPMISPSIGGLLLKYFSWQSIFITLFIIGLILLFISIFYLKESIKSKISFSFSNILKAYKCILSKKSFLIYVISSSFAMGSMFAYISGSSFVFVDIFKLSMQEYALIFGINSLGHMIAARINISLVARFGIDKTTKIAFLCMMISSVLLILTANNIYSFSLFLFCILFTLGFIAPNLATKAMNKSKEYSGSASAILGAIQFTFAGIAAFLVGFLNANTSFSLACIVAIFCFFASLVYLFKSKLIKIL